MQPCAHQVLPERIPTVPQFVTFSRGTGSRFERCNRAISVPPLGGGTGSLMGYVDKVRGTELDICPIEQGLLETTSC